MNITAPKLSRVLARKCEVFGCDPPPDVSIISLWGAHLCTKHYFDAQEATDNDDVKTRRVRAWVAKKNAQPAAGATP